MFLLLCQTSCSSITSKSGYVPCQLATLVSIRGPTQTVSIALSSTVSRSGVSARALGASRLLRLLRLYKRDRLCGPFGWLDWRKDTRLRGTPSFNVSRDPRLHGLRATGKRDNPALHESATLIGHALRLLGRTGKARSPLRCCQMLSTQTSPTLTGSRPHPLPSRIARHIHRRGRSRARGRGQRRAWLG
jgi:hypothetical protein